MQFAAFMATGFGRGIRILAGIILIIIGVLYGGVGGWIVGLIGIVPIFVGIANICVVGPLFGAPLRGSDVAR